MTAPALPLEDHVSTALAVLGRGGVIALPTDTVYGLAALPGHSGGMRRLWRLSGRPPGTGVPLLLAGPEHLPRVAAAVPPPARRLMRRFWPGPLTLLLRAAPRLRGDAFALADVVAVRVPDTTGLRTLIEQAGGVLAVIAASPARGSARADLVLPGPPPTGVTSSIVDCSREPPRLVREGVLARSVLERAAGCTLTR